jgi:hypothetical protein
MELAACGDACGTAAAHHCFSTSKHRQYVCSTTHHFQGRPVRADCEQN